MDILTDYLSQHLLPEIRFTNNDNTNNHNNVVVYRTTEKINKNDIFLDLAHNNFTVYTPRPLYAILLYHTHTHSEPVTFLSVRSRATPPPPPLARRRFGTRQTDDRVQQPAEIWGRYFCYSPCPGTGR